MRHTIEVPFGRVVEEILALSTGRFGKRLVVRVALRRTGPVTFYVVLHGRGKSEKVVLRTRDLSEATAKYNDLFEDFD